MKDIAQGFQKIINHQKLNIFTVSVVTHPSQAFLYLKKLNWQDSSTSTHRNIITLLTAAVVPLYKEVELVLGDDDDLGRFLDGLILWVLDNKADNESTKMSALYMLSSIVNRRSNGK